MFGDGEEDLVEHVHCIKDVDPIDEERVLVSYVTGLYTSDGRLQKWGENGESVESVVVSVDVFPVVGEEFDLQAYVTENHLGETA